MGRHLASPCAQRKEHRCGLCAALADDGSPRAATDFPGYRFLRELPRGGSGARVLVAEPDDATRRRIGLVHGLVVIKSFDFDDGTHAVEMLREGRSLDAARKLGLVLDHEASERRFHYVMRYYEGIDLGRLDQVIELYRPKACWLMTTFQNPLGSLMPEAIWDMVQAEGIHTLNIVGDAMALPLVEVLEQNPGRWDLRELMVVTSAGAVLSTSGRERLEAHLPRGMVMNNFGASETGHQGAAFYDEGKPVWVLDERHTTVLDDQLDPVVPGSGVVGRIARFGHIPLGYYGDPVKTAATFPTRNGRRYAIPGDMATVQEDGAIVFLGRGSACINTGGEKVFAEEVEELLKAHPAVRDAIVVGLPDPRWGQRVVGLVTARGGPVDEETVLAWCRGQIAAYKVPKQLFVVESLARQPSGKPDYPGAQAAAAALAAAT
jgi:hypothetical protein